VSEERNDVYGNCLAKKLRQFCISIQGQDFDT